MNVVTGTFWWWPTPRTSPTRSFHFLSEMFGTGNPIQPWLLLNKDWRTTGVTPLFLFPRPHHHVRIGMCPTCAFGKLKGSLVLSWCVCVCPCSHILNLLNLFVLEWLPPSRTGVQHMVLLFEVGYRQASSVVDLVLKPALQQSGFQVRQVLQDLQGHDRVVEIHWTRS